MSFFNKSLHASCAGCCRSKDRNCAGGYITEAELIKQFEGLIDQMDVNAIDIKDKIKTEVERIKKFQMMLLGKKEAITVDQIDIRNFSKFILREGDDTEKRELIGCFKNKIVLTDKKIELANNQFQN